MTTISAINWADWMARDGDGYDLVLDVRPEKARKASPYPAACIEIFADDLLEDLAWLYAGWPPGSSRLCSVCWNGARALRVTYHLRARGWDAYWWALSPTARAAAMN